MNPEVEAIVRKYVAEFLIFNPVYDRVCVVRTRECIPALNQEIEDWLNRSAIAFGVEGPYVVKWEKLEIKDG